MNTRDSLTDTITFRLTRADLNAIVPFASRDYARVNLAQVAFYANGSMAATDGHRLAYYAGSLAPESAPPVACLLTDHAREIMKATRKADTAIITIAPSDRSFAVMIVDKNDAPRLTMSFKDGDPGFSFPPCLAVFPSRSIDAKDTFQGPEPALGLNGAYLAESAAALGAVLDDCTNAVEIYMWGPLHPIELRAGAWVHVIMPIRHDCRGPVLQGGIEASGATVRSAA